MTADPSPARPPMTDAGGVAPETVATADAEASRTDVQLVVDISRCLHFARAIRLGDHERVGTALGHFVEAATRFNERRALSAGTEAVSADAPLPSEADEGGALRAEVASLRETNARLNRRCQSAEAGLAAKLVSGPSIGRALANSAATMYKAQREEADAEVRRLRDELTRLMIERESLRAVAEAAREYQDAACMSTTDRARKTLLGAAQGRLFDATTRWRVETYPHHIASVTANTEAGPPAEALPDAAQGLALREAADMFHDLSENKRLAEMAEWERTARRYRDEGDMYGWNFYQGMCAGANATDILYQRLGRAIRAALTPPLARGDRGASPEPGSESADGPR